jgi:dethiobiotin synthetase
VKGLFVTGTDTGAGKTYVSRALIAGWRSRGLSVGVMKPCETGWTGPGRGETDAELLLEASGADLTLDEVCPFRFRAPMAPGEAAAVEGGAAVSFERVAERYASIARRHDVTLVEGAGGLIVPFAGDRTAADLVAYLELPLVIVARINLGTINHTCLTVEAARARGLEVLGVIFTRSQDPERSPPGPDEPRNPGAVQRLTGVRIIANLPFDQEVPVLDFPF